MTEWGYINTRKSLVIGELNIIIKLIDGIPPFDSLVLYPELTEISNFTLGADEDSDLVSLPGEVSINVHFKEHTKDVLEILQYLQEKISAGWLNAFIYLDSDLIWQGYVDSKDDKLKLKKEDKTIKITLVDQTLRIRDLDPKTNPFGYADLNANRKITEMIKDFFINSTFGYDNYVTEVVNYSTLEGQATIGGILTTFPFNEFMAKPNFYYEPEGAGYDRLIDVLKSILINYNLFAYIGFDRKLYLIPRFYGSNEVYEIQKHELIDKPEYKISDKIHGMKVNAWRGTHPKESNYYTYILGNYVEGDERSEVLYIDQPCGSFPSGVIAAYSGIAVLNEGLTYPIEPDRVRYKYNDDTYSDYDALYKIVADDNWVKVNFPRLKCEIEVQGYFNKWLPKYFYKLHDADVLFRATQFKYDVVNNKTKISMRQIGTVPLNYRLLEDGSYRLIETGSKRILEYFSGESTPQTDFYRLTEDGFLRLLEDSNKRII